MRPAGLGLRSSGHKQHRVGNLIWSCRDSRCCCSGKRRGSQPPSSKSSRVRRLDPHHRICSHQVDVSCTLKSNPVTAHLRSLRYWAKRGRDTRARQRNRFPRPRNIRIPHAALVATLAASRHVVSCRQQVPPIFGFALHAVRFQPRHRLRNCGCRSKTGTKLQTE